MLHFIKNIKIHIFFQCTDKGQGRLAQIYIMLKFAHFVRFIFIRGKNIRTCLSKMTLSNSILLKVKKIV